MTSQAQLGAMKKVDDDIKAQQVSLFDRSILLFDIII
jgi:hypothetical protein